MKENLKMDAHDFLNRWICGYLVYIHDEIF